MDDEAYCLKCSGRIRKTTFRDMGGWEPDYDSSDDPVTWRHENGYAACPRDFAEPRPPIVVLCGSTRFWKTFQAEGQRLGLEGVIVLSIAVMGSAPDDPEGKDKTNLTPVTAEQKVALDELHKRKIDLADEVLVLNVGGYVGDSTRSEIEYALALGKPVVYLEEHG